MGDNADTIDEHRLGCHEDPPDKRDHRMLDYLAARMTSTSGMGITLPPKISYAEDFTIPVWDQGNFGACVAHAAGAVKWWQEAKQGRRGWIPSRMFLYWRAKKVDGHPEVEGTYIRAALKVLQKEGVPDEKAWPYQDRAVKDGGIYKAPTSPLWGAELQAGTGKIGAYARISNLEEMKQWLVFGGPAVVGVGVWENFNGPGGVVPKPKGKLLGGHALCITGFDDGRGILEFRNSWGWSWGNDGYGAIPYKLWDKLVFVAWAVVDFP